VTVSAVVGRFGGAVEKMSAGHEERRCRQIARRAARSVCSLHQVDSPVVNQLPQSHSPSHPGSAGFKPDWALFGKNVSTPRKFSNINAVRECSVTAVRSYAASVII